MSSRIEDLRDLARMLDEGKISQTEYDIVKTELIGAPAEEWETTGPSPEESVDPDLQEMPVHGWQATLARIPTTYRAAMAGAVGVLVIGGLLAGNGNAAGSVTAPPAALASATSGPAADSLGLVIGDLVEGWNAVQEPPLITGGVMTSPEPGQLDSFLHRFDGSGLLAGAYDPRDGSIHALMVQSSLLDESVTGLYVHLCYLLHPGSQACLDAFIEATGMFGRAHAELTGTEQVAEWEFEGQRWLLEIANDIETIRVQENTTS